MQSLKNNHNQSDWRVRTDAAQCNINQIRGFVAIQMRSFLQKYLYCMVSTARTSCLGLYLKDTQFDITLSASLFASANDTLAKCSGKRTVKSKIGETTLKVAG